MSGSFTTRVVAYTKSDGVLHLVTIRDMEKANRPGGDFLAFPGGGRKFEEFPFQTAQRELREETGLRHEHAKSAFRELGIIKLNAKGRPPHMNIYFAVEFPHEYVLETLESVKNKSLYKVEQYIIGELLPAPIDPSEFLGPHYAQLAKVAPELHRSIFG